jgi:hypothetical protein
LLVTDGVQVLAASLDALTPLGLAGDIRGDHWTTTGDQAIAEAEATAPSDAPNVGNQAMRAMVVAGTPLEDRVQRLMLVYGYSLSRASELATNPWAPVLLLNGAFWVSEIERRGGPAKVGPCASTTQGEPQYGLQKAVAELWTDKQGTPWLVAVVMTADAFTESGSYWQGELCADYTKTTIDNVRTELRVVRLALPMFERKVALDVNFYKDAEMTLALDEARGVVAFTETGSIALWQFDLEALTE